MYSQLVLFIEASFMNFGPAAQLVRRSLVNNTLKRQSIRYHLSSVNSSTVKTNTRMTSSLKQINLMRGWPSPSLLPTKLLASAAERILSDPDIYTPTLQYGADPGYQPLREALATWLSSHYKVTRDAERICISGGASQNIARILQSFTDPTVTKAIWIVAPCYHLVCAIYDDAGFAGRLRAFPEDEEGVDLDELERRILKVEEEYKNKPSQKVVFLISDCVFITSPANSQHSPTKNMANSESSTTTSSMLSQPSPTLPGRLCLYAGAKPLSSWAGSTTPLLSVTMCMTSCNGL